MSNQNHFNKDWILLSKKNVLFCSFFSYLSYIKEFTDLFNKEFTLNVNQMLIVNDLLLSLAKINRFFLSEEDLINNESFSIIINNIFLVVKAYDLFSEDSFAKSKNALILREFLKLSITFWSFSLRHLSESVFVKDQIKSFKNDMNYGNVDLDVFFFSSTLFYIFFFSHTFVYTRRFIFDFEKFKKKREQLFLIFMGDLLSNYDVNFLKFLNSQFLEVLLEHYKKDSKNPIFYSFNKFLIEKLNKESALSDYDFLVEFKLFVNFNRDNFKKNSVKKFDIFLEDRLKKTNYFAIRLSHLQTFLFVSFFVLRRLFSTIEVERLKLHKEWFTISFLNSYMSFLKEISGNCMAANTHVTSENIRKIFEWVVSFWSKIIRILVVLEVVLREEFYKSFEKNSIEGALSNLLSLFIILPKTLIVSTVMYKSEIRKSTLNRIILKDSKNSKILFIEFMLKILNDSGLKRRVAYVDFDYLYELYTPLKDQPIDIFEFLLKELKSIY